MLTKQLVEQLVELDSYSQELYKIVRSNPIDSRAYLDLDYNVNYVTGNKALDHCLNKDPSVKRSLNPKEGLLTFYTTTGEKKRGIFMRRVTVDLNKGVINADEVIILGLSCGRCVAAPVVFEIEHGKVEMFVQYNFCIEDGKDNRAGIAHLISFDDGLTFNYQSTIAEFPSDQNLMMYDANHYSEILENGSLEHNILVTVYSTEDNAGTSFHKITKVGDGEWKFNSESMLCRDKIPFHWHEDDDRKVKEWFGPEALQIANFRDLKVAMWTNFYAGQKLGVGLVENGKIDPLALIFNPLELSEKLGKNIGHVGHHEIVTNSLGNIFVDSNNNIQILVQILPTSSKEYGYNGDIEDLWRIALVTINADVFYRSLKLQKNKKNLPLDTLSESKKAILIRERLIQF